VCEEGIIDDFSASVLPLNVLRQCPLPRGARRNPGEPRRRMFLLLFSFIRSLCSSIVDRVCSFRECYTSEPLIDPFILKNFSTKTSRHGTTGPRQPAPQQARPSFLQGNAVLQRVVNIITTRNPANFLGGRRQINKTKKYADWCAQQIVSEMEFNRISGLNGATVASSTA